MNLLKNAQLTTKISAGYGVTIASMTIIAIVVYAGVSNIRSASKWVNHTYEVIRTAESVNAAMVDMETGQRGFMITGQDEYLEPYNAGKNRIQQLIEQGATLTSDNPAQGDRWNQVNQLQQKWQSEAAQVEINARREVEKGFEATANFQTLSESTTGKEIFDSIRAILNNLDQQFTVRGMEPASQLITLLTLDLVNMETGQRGFLLTGQEQSLEPFVMGQKSFRTHISQLTNLTSSIPNMGDNIQFLASRVVDWLEQAAQPEIDARREINQYPTTMTDIKIMMQNGQGKNYMDTIRGILTEIVDAEEVLITVRAKEQQASSSFVVQTTILGTLFAIIFSIVTARFVSRGISQPIALINTTLEDIAQGDLTKRINVDSNNELGAVASYINKFLDQLQGTFKNIGQSTNQIVEAANQMKTATSESRQQLVSQSEEISQVALSLNEMTDVVGSVAQSTESANNSASNANNRTMEGNELVLETLSSIQDLSSDIETSAEALNHLKLHSEKIGTVLDVIKNIAEQTNLLALNAAIEAARAGEQGRGFAVVADEVRTLAKRTQDSTFEIQTIIQDIQTGSENAVTAMELSCEKSSNTLSKAEKTGEFLSSINEAISEVLDLNTQISTAAQEQEVMTQDVNLSVENINTIARASSTRAEETELAGDKVADLSTHLQQLANQFRV